MPDPILRAIPYPQPTVPSLMETVLATKMVVETLSGMRGGDVGRSLRYEEFTNFLTNYNSTVTIVTGVVADLDALEASFAAHIANVSNPHAVTKAQVGLGNVDNTSDVNKPVSTAQAAADAAVAAMIPALASTTEVLQGVSTTKTVTPDALAALWEYGGAVPAASIITLGEGGHFLINSAGTIDNLEYQTKKDGRRVIITCNTSPIVFKHNGAAIAAGKMNLPGNVDFTGSAGDVLEFVQAFTNQMYCVSIRKANGSVIPTGLASTTDVLTGTDAAKAVTADALAALWELGPAVAAASAVTLGEGGYFEFTSGSGSVNGILFTTFKSGRRAWVYSNVACTLVHSATLQLPGNANIVVAPGDRFEVVAVTASVTRVAVYSPVSGKAVIPPAYSEIPGTPTIPTVPALASTTEVLQGVNTAKTVTPDAMAALWEAGTVTTAAQVILGEGGYIVMTGAGTVNSIEFATKKDGRRVFMYMNTAGIILKYALGTAGAGILLLPGSSDIVTVAGDVLELVQTSTNFMVAVYHRVSGKALIPPTYAEVSGKPASTDNAIARFDGVAGLLQNSAATVNDTTGAIKAGSFCSIGTTSIADDAVFSVALSTLIASAIYATGILTSSFGHTPGGLFRLITSTTDTPAAVASAFNVANTNFSNVVLTGTTGVDGKLTISVNNGTLYIENRLGASYGFSLVLLGG